MVTIAFPKYEEVVSHLSQKLNLPIVKIEQEIEEFGKTRYSSMQLRKEFIAIFYAREKGFPVVIKHIPTVKKKMNLREIVQDARGITIEGLILSKRQYVSRKGDDTTAFHITDGTAVFQSRAKVPFAPKAGDFIRLGNVNVSFFKERPYIWVGQDTDVEVLPKVKPSDFLPSKKIGDIRTGEIVSIRAVPLQERINSYVGCPLCNVSIRETAQGAPVHCENCGKNVNTIRLAWKRFLLMDDSGTIFCSMPPSFHIENTTAYIGKIVEIFGQVQDSELRVWDIRLCPEFKIEKMADILEPGLLPPVIVESKSSIIGVITSRSSVFEVIQTKSEVVK